MNGTLPNKRVILQPLLESIEGGWRITQPTPLFPTDIEELCIFQHPEKHREARVSIPNSYFALQCHNQEIERLVRKALATSVRKIR